LTMVGDYYDDDYNEEAESDNAAEEGTELNDEVENSIQVTTSDPEALTKVIEKDVVTIEGRSFEEEREASEETTTAKEDSLVNETLTEDNFEKETSKEGKSLVETSGEEILEESLEEESLVECFYVTPSTTFSSLPDSISCSCSGAAATFKWSSLEPEALLSLSSVLLTNCSILQLDLRPRPSILSSPMPSLNVEGTVGQVQLLLTSLPLSAFSLNIDRVPRVEVTVAGNEEATKEDIDPLVLGLGALSIVLLGLVLLLLVCLHRHRREGDGEHKKVSRAESWRYESSIYVQTPGGARPKPVYVAPPLPPPGLATPPTPHATWSRDTAPESGSSSPLLRGGGGGAGGGQYNAYSGVRGVDVVRTSLNARQEPTPTPPGPRQSRHRGRKAPTQRQDDSLTDSGSDSESRRNQHQVSTLPTR